MIISSAVASELLSPMLPVPTMWCPPAVSNAIIPSFTPRNASEVTTDSTSRCIRSRVFVTPLIRKASTSTLISFS